MANKIFNKKLSHACKYCEFAAKAAYGDDILCRYRGVTRPDDNCHKYRYDPFKRVPQKIKVNKNFSSKDFEL